MMIESNNHSLYLRFKYMVYVNVDSMSTQELEQEISKRREGDRDDYGIPLASARDTLIESSDYFRKIGRVDLAYKLDEVREDYL